MKKIIIAFFLNLFVLSFLTSCSDFLDKEPDDMLTQQMAFNNVKNTNAWLAGIYNPIRDPLVEDIFNIGCMSDDFQPVLELAQFGWGNIISALYGSWGPSTGMQNYWGDFYKAIRAGYIFIDNVKALPDQGLTEEEADFMKHEARYLIAY